MSTLTISTLPEPEKAKTALRALFITGYVKVTLHGGGLGESSIDATHLSVTSSKGWPIKRRIFSNHKRIKTCKIYLERGSKYGHLGQHQLTINQSWVDPHLDTKLSAYSHNLQQLLLLI
jgi:hypothetical protein